MISSAEVGDLIEVKNYSSFKKNNIISSRGSFVPPLFKIFFHCMSVD